MLLKFFSTVVLLFTISGDLMSDANPIPPNNEAAYCAYKRLLDQSNITWGYVFTLFSNFKNDRFPNQDWVMYVNVSNLPSTDTMTRKVRSALPEMDWLSKHLEFLLNYDVIIDYLLADEANTTSATNFVSEITEARRLIGVTIADLENTMLTVGLAPLTNTGAVSASISGLSEENSPKFDPFWEQDTDTRYKRDIYVLEEMRDHLRKTVEDFSYMQGEFHGPTPGSSAPTCV